MPDIRTSKYNKAVTAAVRHLRSAATYEPQVRSDGYHRGKLEQVVTSDSLKRYLKANKIKGNEKQAIEQVFTTLAGRQSRGEDVTVCNVTQLKALTKTLKGFAATHNDAPKSVLDTAEQKKMGKTGKALIKAADVLIGRDFDSVQTEKNFAKVVDQLLEHLLVKANTGLGYLTPKELYDHTATLPRTARGRDLKDALWDSFSYLSRVMSRGTTNRKQICIDQRREATRHLLKLFAGNSATKQSIMKVVADGGY